MISLNELPLHCKARIVQVDDSFLELQMISKGLITGGIIEVSRKTLGGTCLYVDTNTHAIALQKTLANNIYVEEI